MNIKTIRMAFDQLTLETLAATEYHYHRIVKVWQVTFRQLKLRHGLLALDLYLGKLLNRTL